MAWRFRKSVSLGGFRINLSKSGIGLSTGVRGLRFGFSPRKGSYSSIGIPGTGLYSINYSGKKRKAKQQQTQVVRPAKARSPLQSMLTASVVLLAVGVLIIAFSDSPASASAPVLIAIVLFLIYIFNKRVRVHYGMRRAARGISRGDTDRAISTLERLVEKYQKFDHPKELLAHLYQEKGRFGDAIPLWENLYGKYNYDIFGLRLSEAYFFSSRYKDALSILQKLDLESELKAKIILLMASCFEELGDYATAIETYKRAPLLKRNLDDELISVHYGLAKAYEKTEDRANALKHYKRIYAVNINYKDVSQRIEQLSK